MRRTAAGLTKSILGNLTRSVDSGFDDSANSEQSFDDFRNLLGHILTRKGTITIKNILGMLTSALLTFALGPNYGIAKKQLLNQHLFRAIINCVVAYMVLHTAAILTTYIYMVCAVYGARLLSRGYFGAKTNNSSATGRVHFSWKLGLHILFFVISVLPLITVGAYNLVKASQLGLQNPCNTEVYSAGVTLCNAVFVVVLIFILRSVADPLLHICWEPELRNGLVKLKNCIYCGIK